MIANNGGGRSSTCGQMVVGRLNRWLPGIAAALLVGGTLGGCASVGGAPVTVERMGGHMYRLHGQYTAPTDTKKVLLRQMHQAADRECPQGWTLDSQAPNGYAVNGGQVWEIQCTGAGNGAAMAPQRATENVPAPAPVPVRGSSAGLLRILSAAVLRAAPDLSARAARAIAQTQLNSMAAAGMTVRDAKGRTVLSAEKH